MGRGGRDAEREPVMAALLAVAFAAVAALVEAGQVAGLDADIGAARGTPGAGLVEPFRVVTDLGGVGVVAFLTVVSCAALAAVRRFSDALMVGLAVIGSRALTSLLKLTFERDRPAFRDAIGSEDSFAFPSGHTSAATALYGALAVLVLRSRLPRGLRTGAGALLALIVAGVAYSRVYLGVHYASDVVGGALLGGACLAAAVGGASRLTRSGRAPRPADARA